MRGSPREVSIPKAALDPTVRRQLWDLSSRITGVNFATVVRH
jgi:hypothetical protein